MILMAAPVLFGSAFRLRWFVRAIAIGLLCLGVASPGETQDGAPESVPGLATLVAPGGSVTTSTPAFTWNAVPATGYYLLRVTDRDNVSTDRWYRPDDAGCASETAPCTAATNVIVKPGSASWQVLTWNTSGYGPWSEPGSFLVEIADPMGTAPAAVRPKGTLVSTDVPYEWTAVSGARNYRLSIRNNDGPPAIFWYTPSAAGCDAAADCVVVPPLRLTNGTAEWQVQAWTSDGYGPWTEPVALSVEVPVFIRPDRQVSAVKLIEYGWDRPTPAFVRDHIREMEQRPMDGVIMGLPDGGGDVFRLESWNPDALAPQLPILGSIAWQTFDSNFLAMYAASSMDWYGEADWGVVLQHAAFLARAAHEGHCKGLMFDPEPYGASPWTYSKQPHASEHSFREYEAMVRSRGRAFMQALQQEYPGLDLLTFYSYSSFLRIGAAADADTREAALKNDPWGLLPAFLDGMLEAADANSRIIDGQEQAYYAELPSDFAKGDAGIRDGALAFVSPELQDTYVRHVETAHPVYLDWIFGYFKTSPAGMSEGLTDDQRAQLFEHHTYYAMKNVDRYVWVYSEKMNWWTGEHVPPGADDALRSARNKFESGQSLGFDVPFPSQTAP